MLEQQGETVNGRDPSKNKIDIAQALKLRLVNHLSYQEIADRFGVCKSAVYQSLKRFLAILVEPDELNTYESHKAALLASVELKILEKMVNDGVLEKASLNNLAYSFRQIFDAGRLERGKATENVDVHCLLKDTEEMERKIQALREVLKNE